LSFTILSEHIVLRTTLPFSWSMLFYAAITFTIANIIYAIFCPEIFKQYRSFAEFKADGKTIRQVVTLYKKMIWSNYHARFKDETDDKLFMFITNFIKRGITPFNEERPTHKCWKHKGAQEKLALLSSDPDYSLQEPDLINAFYFVHECAAMHNRGFAVASFTFYALGIVCVSIIAVENFIYVYQTF